MSLRLAFMGTPDFAVPSLAAAIDAGHEVACVYTRAPRPAGRGMDLRPSPVHRFAEAAGIEVRTPRTLRDPDEQARFEALDLDLAVVAAYGLILPVAVLEAPALGCINLHASILPRWRGAAPIQRAIMAGDAETGVTVMQMSAGLDEGDMLLMERVAITAATTAGSLHDDLAAIAASLTPRALAAIERDSIVPTRQPARGVVYAAKIDKAEARIDWTRPAAEVDRHIRGLSPFPGAWFAHDGQRVKVLMSAVADASGAPGTVLDDALTVACGSGAVRLLDLQRAGRKAMPVADFQRGTPIAAGTVLESGTA